MTSVLSSLASPNNPLTSQEKEVLHSLIHGFAQVFTPSVKDAQSDLNKMTEEMKKHVDDNNNINNNNNAKNNHDELLNPQTLLGMFTSGDEFNTKLIADLAETFLSTLEKQMNKGQEVGQH